MTSRRQFIRIVPMAGAALLAASAARAEMLDENNPQAKALGYVADASRADKTRFKQYAVGQTCANCDLYTGKAGDVAGGCKLFPGKEVAAKGWCSAYVVKKG